MLAHAASAQGSAVMGTPMNCDVIPAAAFTTPECAMAHICGPHAADLIGEPALAMSAKLPVDIIAKTIHAHPTLGEVIHAAASSV